MSGKLRSKVLKIDLSKYKYEVEDRKDLFEEWIGGVGVAVQLLKEELDFDEDPLGENNVIVFATGPFTPAYPLASKTVALFKSPLTGNLGESHAGGRTASSIANAGYGAILIKGRSRKPIYVVVDEDKVHFKDGRVIWRVKSSIVTGRIIAEREEGRGIRTVMRIGEAGIKLVRYACLTTETYRHFGRLGLGAVFGSKNLKALVVMGRKKYTPSGEGYREIYDMIYKKAVESDAMRKYHLLGTAENILPLNELNALPTRNLQSARFEKAEEISGEAFAEYSLGRRIACNHCPTACIHIAVLREPYEKEKYFYKTIMISYDYELIYSLGSMLGIGDRSWILKLIHKVETLGLDAMSTGVCLAWATEAFERGMISERETIVKLEFGNAENYLKAIDYIVDQPNEFYSKLAEGVEVAALHYGGVDFALSFGKNEMAGYHTGPATYVGYLIGLRHSHLDNAGYSLDQKMKGLTPEEMVERLVNEEKWRQILSSLVVCFFARGVYTPDIVVKAFKPLGVEYSENELYEIGGRIYREKIKLKRKMGFEFDELRIPKRVYETKSTRGLLEEDYIVRALNYYRERYWDNV